MSTIVSPSRFVREALRDAIGATFNAALLSACDQFGVGAYTYALNLFEGKPRNFFEGNRTLDELVLHGEPDLPACTMWTGDGQDQNLQKPRTFSGVVMGHWRFFLAINGLRSTGLISLREATEAALIATLLTLGDDTAYRKDITWGTLPEQVWLDRDQKAVGFIQEFEVQAGFEVNL